MNTHPPIKHNQSIILSLYIYFGWFMGWEVADDGVVGGFIGWVVVGLMGWVVGGLMGWVCVVVWVVVGWVVGGFMGWVHILTHQ